MPYELKSALGKVGPSHMKFGLYRGSKGVQVLISAAKPTDAQLGDMMTQTGSKKPVFDGICFREESTVVFASKVGVAGMKPVSTAMKDHATGLAFELRDLGDGDEAASSSGLDTSNAGTPPVSATTPPAQAAWAKSAPKPGTAPRPTAPGPATPKFGASANVANKPTAPSNPVVTPGATGPAPTPGAQQPTGNAGWKPAAKAPPGGAQTNRPNVPPTATARTPNVARTPGAPSPGQQQAATNRPPNAPPPQTPVPGSGQPGSRIPGAPPPRTPGQPGGIPPRQAQPNGPVRASQATGQPSAPPPTAPPPRVPNQPTGQQGTPPSPVAPPSTPAANQPGTRPPNTPPRPTPTPATGQPGTPPPVKPPPSTGQQGTPPPVTPPPTPNQPTGQQAPPTAPPPQATPVQNPGPARPAQGPKGAADAAGIRTASLRSAAALQEADVVARAAAQKAFPRGTAKAAKATLAKGPVAVDRKKLAAMTEKLDKAGALADYVGKAKNEKEKKQREAVVQRERAAADGMAIAMKNAEGSKVPAKNLDELEVACQEGVDSFGERIMAAVKNADRSIGMASGDNAKAAAIQKRAALLQGPEAARLTAAADALLEAKLRKSEKVIADLGTALTAAEANKADIAAVEKVQAMASEYRKLFTEHAAHYEKLPSVARPPAIVQREQMIDNILEEADATLFSAKQAKLGPPPWGPADQAEGNNLIDKGRELMAKNLLRNGQVSRPKGGSSDVSVMKTAAGKTQFAFKAAKGESSQMKLPPGGGAIREAVSSKVADAVLEQTGLDFGFPKVTIATLDGKVGALVEGIDGTELPAADKVKPQDKAATAAFQNAIPGKQLQKTVFAGLAMGNFLDLKWDNVFWEGQGSSAVARPFDAGAAFLPTKEIKYALYGRSGQPGFDAPLLSDAEGNTVQGATEPMDDELMQAMLKINVPALEKVIDDELQRQAPTGLDQCLDLDSKKNGLKCLTALQTVLLAHKDDFQPPSLADVMADMQVEIMKLFPDT